MPWIWEAMEEHLHSTTSRTSAAVEQVPYSSGIATEDQNVPQNVASTWRNDWDCTSHLFDIFESIDVPDINQTDEAQRIQSRTAEECKHSYEIMFIQ